MLLLVFSFAPRPLFESLFPASRESVRVPAPKLESRHSCRGEVSAAPGAEPLGAVSKDRAGESAAVLFPDSHTFHLGDLGALREI